MPNKKLKVKSSNLETRLTSPGLASRRSGSRRTQGTSMGSKLKVDKGTALKAKVSKRASKTPEVIKEKNALEIEVYDTKGKVTGTVYLAESVFGAKINNPLIAQAIRAYQANQRVGSASTKTRGEVKGSTRKIYRQKGTGRARHGAIRAPIFVHGGIAHGPKPRDFGLKMPKKMKRAALFSALSVKATQQAIRIVEGIERIEPKTKEMANVLRNLKLESKNKKILFVMPKDKEEELENIKKAVRNIEGVTYTYTPMMNTYETVNNKIILFMKDSLDSLEATFTKGERK